MMNTKMMSPFKGGGPKPTPPGGMQGDGDMDDNGDMEHLQLKRDLGVPPAEEIPGDKMDRAMAGAHGPEVQQRAMKVKAKRSGPGMGQIFAPARRVGKDNSAKPQPQQPAAKQRFGWGKE